MIKLGITGGIGSGKSTVSTLFQLLGVPVYNADEETKKLNNKSPIIREQLMKHFGEDLYHNYELDKKKFANIIFNDAEKLELANSIIHPEVLKHFVNWCKEHSNHSIVALEAAILFESGFHKHLDIVVTVYSPLNLRVERVSERDKTTPEMVRSRIKHQMPETEKIDMSEYVIINDNQHSLIDQVEKLLKDINQSTNSA
ncbi:MAG: dephospho-CoA kinase [Bacteroidales bacterium]|nr:dephospho-CoA kinase [Bacteroidales bacterium]